MACVAIRRGLGACGGAWPKCRNPRDDHQARRGDRRPRADALKNEYVSDYLAALERLFVVEDERPWQSAPAITSILRKSVKRHLVDPSLAVAALGADPAALLKDLNLLGFVFESLVVRDLRVHSQPRGEVRQYLDNKGLEVDAIVQTKDAWAAFEVKLGRGT